jgi:putative hemolysin
MEFWLSILIAAGLFFVGVRLSAFFSGSETGFYRISFLRLSIDAHAGDSTAKGIMWFLQNPSYFVATTLVGNNIANYVTTVAIGIGVASLNWPRHALLDVGTTLLFTPLIFVFGELMPKNLYFRAPSESLRKGHKKFHICYLFFLPISIPLVWGTRLLEKMSHVRSHSMDLVLGRHRLIQVLDKGHEHGLLTSEQGELVHGLLHDASRKADEIMMPAARIMGLEETASREQLIEFGKEYGLVYIPIRKSGTADDWFGYVTLLDLRLNPESPAIEPLPEINRDATRLTALLTLRETGRALGVVRDDNETVGILSERALIQHFMHPASGSAS